VYTRSNTTWTLQQKLAPETNQVGYPFGNTAALVDDLLVLGDDASTNQGGVYLYTRNQNSWSRQFRLSAADGTEGDSFGSALAINAHTIVVGASKADLPGGTNQGAVYFYGHEPVGIIPGGTSPIILHEAEWLAGGSFHFTFTNNPSLPFTALLATNGALPLSQWTVLGSPTETSPGQYQFTDSQANNGAARFYRVRSP
jgi:hypothetical protein